MKRWHTFALLVAVVASLAAIGATASYGRVDAPAKAENHTIKVGIVYSRSGLLSNYGAMYAQGVRYGLEYATNGTNTVNGHKIELTLVDDATDPAKAVSAAKDLIGQGYKIIAGSTSSGAGLAVAPLAEQNKILFIAGAAATDALTGINRYSFRAGRQTIQDIMCARTLFSANEVGKKVVTFAQDSAFGQSIAAGVTSVFGGKGHQTSRILVPQSATDFTPFAAQLKSANADLTYVAWAGTTATAMYTALQQQGVPASTKIVSGIAERATWNLFGQSLQGLDLVSLYFPEASKNKVNTVAAREDAHAEPGARHLHAGRVRHRADDRPRGAARRRRRREDDLRPGGVAVRQPEGRAADPAGRSRDDPARLHRAARQGRARTTGRSS